MHCNITSYGEFIQDEIARVLDEFIDIPDRAWLSDPEVRTRLSTLVFIKTVRKRKQPSISMKEHFSSIQSRQQRIVNIIVEPRSMSGRIGNDVSPACIANLENKWVAVFIGKACNVTCKFCPQPPKPKFRDARDTNGHINTTFGRVNLSDLERKIYDKATKGQLDAIAYTGGEPLLYVDRITKIARSIQVADPKTYQYVYTNGILANHQNLERLAAAGISEIRFDIAAARFGNKVLKNIEVAGKIFPRVVIESPSVVGISKKLANIAERLISSGVSQINLCEMLINEHNYNFYQNEPYYIFNPYSSGDSVSDLHGTEPDMYARIIPTWSRHETYDLLEIAAREKWPIVVQDIPQSMHYKEVDPF